MIFVGKGRFFVGKARRQGWWARVASGLSAAFRLELDLGFRVQGSGSTWRLMGSYKWGYKSPSMYSYPTFNPIL